MINITNMTEDKYYSIEEIAKMLNVAYLTVYRWVRNNKLLAVKAGKQYRISKAELNLFINRKK